MIRNVLLDEASSAVSKCKATKIFVSNPTKRMMKASMSTITKVQLIQCTYQRHSKYHVFWDEGFVARYAMYCHLYSSIISPIIDINHSTIQSFPSNQVLHPKLSSSSPPNLVSFYSSSLASVYFARISFHCRYG
jgi:hypothetical protein